MVLIAELVDKERQVLDVECESKALGVELVMRDRYWLCIPCNFHVNRFLV